MCKSDHKNILHSKRMYSKSKYKLPTRGKYLLQMTGKGQIDLTHIQLLQMKKKSQIQQKKWVKDIKSLHKRNWPVNT